MSVAAITWAWQQRDLGTTPKFVLVALCDFADARGENCFPGQKRLAEMTSLDERSVRRALADLEQRQKIQRHVRYNQHGRDYDGYRILCEPSRLRYEPDNMSVTRPVPDNVSGTEADTQSGRADRQSGGTGHIDRQNRINSPEPSLFRSERFDPPSDPKDQTGTRAGGSETANKPKVSRQPGIAVSWPDDFRLTDEMRSFAMRFGVEPETEFAAWKDDCAAHGRRYLDWTAAWRTRIRMTQHYGPQRDRARQIADKGRHMSPGMAELGRIFDEVRSDGIGTDRNGAGTGQGHMAGPGGRPANRRSLA